VATASVMTRPFRPSLALAIAVALVGVTLWATPPATGASRPKNHKAEVARVVALRELRGMVAPGLRAPTPPISPAESLGLGTTTVYFYNWSGYADTTPDTYTEVSGSWKQPSVKCTQEDQFSVFWVGLDGLANGTVEQDGTYAQCFQGTAYYGTWWEMYPTNEIQVYASANPGDKVTASVSFAGSEFTLAVTDSTTASASFSTSQTCVATVGCARSSAEWIAERPSGTTGLYPLADFKPWQLTNASVATSSTTGVISTFPDEAVDMIDTTDTYDLASVGGLSASAVVGATTGTVARAKNTTGFIDTWDDSY
jgi:Peptidase A4 family